METLPQRIFRKDLEGRFTFGNGNFCRARNRPLDEIIGKTDFDFSPPELAARYQADDRRVSETGQTLDVVEEYVKPDGSPRYVHTIKTPVYGPDGRIAGVQGIHWDITDRKLAEQALERTNAQLARGRPRRADGPAGGAAGQRGPEARPEPAWCRARSWPGWGRWWRGWPTRSTTRCRSSGTTWPCCRRDVEAVVGVLGIYRQADPVIAERKPELSAELVDAAERTDLPYTLENLNELLARSADGLRRIQQIVQDLRHFARLDEADLHDADLNAGIESTVNIVQGAAKARRVRIETHLAALPPVACFPAKLNQVVMNLLTNAIDASPEGRAGDGADRVDRPDRGPRRRRRGGGVAAAGRRGTRSRRSRRTRRFGSRWPTRGRGSTRRSRPGSSTRSSRPSRRERGRGWG